MEKHNKQYIAKKDKNWARRKKCIRKSKIQLNFSKKLMTIKNCRIDSLLFETFCNQTFNCFHAVTKTLLITFFK